LRFPETQWADRSHPSRLAYACWCYSVRRLREITTACGAGIPQTPSGLAPVNSDRTRKSMSFSANCCAYFGRSLATVATLQSLALPPHGLRAALDLANSSSGAILATSRRKAQRDRGRGWTTYADCVPNVAYVPGMQPRRRTPRPNNDRCRSRFPRTPSSAKAIGASRKAIGAFDR
jgi:hypothetical protein